MIVTKQWFVIYDANGIIHLHGDNTGQRTETSLNQEFDTKAQMDKYIKDKWLHLIIRAALTILLSFLLSVPAEL